MPKRVWTGLFPVRTLHKSLDSVFQVNNIEVYKQPDGFATKFEVGNHLSMVDWCNGIGGFDLKNDGIFHP